MMKEVQRRIFYLKWKPLKFLMLHFSFVIPSLTVAQSTAPYYEDLNKWRPTFESKTETKTNNYVDKIFSNAVPTKMINAKVDIILDSIDQFNLQNKFIDGYTIQIYSSQKREEAIHAKKKLQEEIPYLTGILSYQQPKFRVTVGKYFTKIDAQSDLSKLKREFSMAIVVPEKVQINHAKKSTN